MPTEETQGLPLDSAGPQDGELDFPPLTPEQEEDLRFAAELNSTELEEFAKVQNFENAWSLLEFLTSTLNQHNWVFRGHANQAWKLEPSVERLKKQRGIRRDAEQYIRKTFKRRAHHYIRDVPREDEDLEWMALMRHHGAPTRLLDWTRSPYVATFFAVAEAVDQTSAVWAIDINAVRSEAIQMLVESGMTFASNKDFSFSSREWFEQVFLQEISPPPIVAPVQPLRMNKRVTSQQGLFLCPTGELLPWGFEYKLKRVLVSHLRRHEASLLSLPLFKLCIAPGARVQLLRELHRMNINYATLFPGLDGFARSLGTAVTLSGWDVDIIDGEFEPPV